MFIARDENRDLYLFAKMPQRGVWDNSNVWMSDDPDSIQINNDLFPNLSWNDEPLEVTMKQEDSTLALSDNNAQQINHVWAMYATLQQETSKLREENAYWRAKLEDLKKLILNQ